jgi:signal transduction histidine kinase
MITSEKIGAMAWVETAYLLTDMYWRICFASDVAGLPFCTSPGELEGRTLPELLGHEVFDELRTCLNVAVTLNGAEYVVSVRQMQVQGLSMRVVELREAEASLAHVISQIIHELKNPLSAMQALVQSLEEDLKDDSNARQYTSRLVSEIERLSRLLSSMARFSRLKYRPTKVFSLLTLMRYISDLFEQDFRRRNVNMQVICAQADVQFRGDPDQMAQLFVNLITNAIDAMPNGGVITVNLITKQDGTVGIKVADTGVGMSKEEVERITKSLYSSKAEGMGLGLSIVRSIVRHHGGRISISSNEGLGSEVTITFPAFVL